MEQAQEPKVSAQVSEQTFKLVNALAEERKESRAAVVRGILERYAYSYQIKEAPLKLDHDHWTIIAPTLWGKTFLAYNYIIPRVEEGRRIVVLASHDEQKGEYQKGYRTVPFRFDSTILDSSNPLFDALQFSSIGSETRAAVSTLMQLIAQTKQKKMTIRLRIADPKAERMIVTELLKRMANVEEPWHPPMMLIIEEAKKYDCQAIVSRGRHQNIQAILITQDPLDAETMSNTRLILGPISRKLSENIDPAITFALLNLHKRGAFLWEPTKGQWKWFRYVKKGEE